MVLFCHLQILHYVLIEVEQILSVFNFTLQYVSFKYWINGGDDTILEKFF